MKWNHRLSQLSTNGRRASLSIERLAKESTGYSVATTGWVVDRVLEARARFVVGADGHNSVVRRSLGLDFAELADPQFFGVFEFGANAAAQSEVRVVLDEASTNVLWPLADGRFRWSFQLEDSWEFMPDTRAKNRLAVQIGEDTFPYLDRSEDERAGRRAGTMVRLSPGRHPLVRRRAFRTAPGQEFRPRPSLVGRGRSPSCFSDRRAEHERRP